MPKILITFDYEHRSYFVEPYRGQEVDPEYQAVMDMKASHFINIKRNEKRYENDRETLRKFFIQAQMRGRQFREI